MNINKTNITIVVPVYQVEKFIDKCIDSLENQTDNNFRVIFVNDGSLDNSAKICEQACSNNDNFKLVHKPNNGLSSARNFGIKHVETEYVLFLDSDDWLNHKTIEILNNLLERNTYDIISFKNKMVKVRYADFPLKPLAFKDFTGSESLKYMLQNKLITSFSTDKVFKVELFRNNKIAFPVGKYYEDLATVYKLLALSEKVLYINQELYYYYIANEDAITAKFDKQKLEDIFENYQKIDLYIQNNEFDEIIKNTSKAYYLNGLLYTLFKIYQVSINNKSVRSLESKVTAEIDKTNVDSKIMKFQPQYFKFLLYKVGILKLTSKLLFYIRTQE